MLTHQSDIIFQTSAEVSPSVGKEQKLFSGSRELCETLLELTNGMQRVFGTESGDVTFCAGSSVEAWDQAIASTLNEGDKVLVLRSGAASASLEAQVAGLGLDVESVGTPTGVGLPIRELSRRLGEDVRDEIKVVFVTLDDAVLDASSTVLAIRRELDENFHEALLCVDVVAPLGSVSVDMDAWEADLVVSQGEGLGIIAFGAKAIEIVNNASDTAQIQTHSLPSIKAVYALLDEVERIEDQGAKTPVTRRFRVFEGYGQAHAETLRGSSANASNNWLAVDASAPFLIVAAE